MKKIIFALAVILLAAPAWASVDVNCTCDGDEVTVIFDARSETDPNVRAFALDITVDSGAKITGASNFSSDFTIYPGSIDINGTTGDVDNAGSPIGDPCVYGDTLGGVGTSGMTIEMGSLYVGEANAPDPCGVLLTFTVTEDCTVTLAGNVSRAGSNGVVKEDPCATPTVNLGTCEVTGLDCFVVDEPNDAQWASVGKPVCWCFDRQCHGDADGYPEGKFNYWAAGNDLTILKAAWSKPFPDINGVTATVGDPPYEVPVICADFDRLPEGKFNYRVGGNDLLILKDNWSIANKPDPNCVPGGETPPW